MQTIAHTIRKPQYFLLSLLLLIVGLSFFAVVPTHAADNLNGNSRLQYGNIDAYCGNNTTLGMVWLSNDGSNYYSETVNVGANDTFVGVEVRGAANSCNYNWENPAKIYATNVSTGNPRLAINGSEFFRGDLPAGTRNWTTKGGALSGTLNVGGIAVCNGTGRVESSIVVNIQRTLKYTQGNDSRVLGPGSEDVTVRVSRDCPTPQWTLNGQSYIKNTGADKSRDAANPVNLSQGRIKASPNNRLNWYHDIRNNGPDNMERDIFFKIDRGGFSNGWNDDHNPSGNGRGGSGVLFVYEYARFLNDLNRPASHMTLYDVEERDLGNQLCQRIAWTPSQWNTTANVNWAQSVDACAAVPYEYRITPTITGVNDGATIESDKRPVTVQGVLTNGQNADKSGPTRTVKNVRWQITQMVFAPGVAIPQKNGNVSSSDPCLYVTGEVNGSCKSLQSGTEADGLSATGTDSSRSISATDEAAAYSVGTRVCYLMSVDNYTARYNGASANNWQEYDSRWLHSDMSCVTVAKKPKVQILGGDLLVGRRIAGVPAAPVASNVATSTSYTNADKLFGSWGEYGIAATGTVTRMASGSGNATGYAAPSAFNLCDVSLLTFTNQRAASGSLGPMCDSTKIGQYAFGSAMPNIASRFSTVGAPALSGTVNISSVINGASANSRIYTSNAGSLTLTGGSPINAGKWIVINAPNTDVTISGNINYTTDTLRSMSDIPQVVIIARNITIAENVTNVDAWLVAYGAPAAGGSLTNGVISTCNVAFSDLTSSKCGTRLTVNGPVLANRLVMLRTAGAGPGNQAGEPGEVFNLRPDAYLWVANQSANSGRVTSVETTELPPRF